MEFNPIALLPPTGECVPLWQAQTSDTVHLLGVCTTVDGNTVAEEQAFKKKCNKHVQIVSCHPLMPNDAMMVHQFFALLWPPLSGQTDFASSNIE